MATMLDPGVADALRRGLVIPACPLALTAQRRFDCASSASFISLLSCSRRRRVGRGVHTTQFAIRDPKFGLFRPLLQLAPRR